MLFTRCEMYDQTVDLRILNGTIETIAPAGSLSALPGELARRGGLITAPTAEPHVHLDATLLGTRAPNRSGTLREGIQNWAALRETLTEDDVYERATTVIDWYKAHGTLRIRTHVDTGCPVAVHTLLALRDEVKAKGITLQVVAFPQEGVLRAPGQLKALEEAVKAGCDAVGGIPHFERTTEEGWQSVREVFKLADKYDRMVDFHCDETDDPGSRNLEVVCANTLDRGWSDRVVAGHCTALAAYPNPHAAKVIELVVCAGVQIIVNPLDNTVLQGRYDSYPRRRGLTRVDQLWAAGANVGVGHDSIIDPWYRLGTANLLDAAHMLLHVGHLTSIAQMRQLFHTLSQANHTPFGGPPRLAEGDEATLLWYAASDPVEALRTRERPDVYLKGRRLGDKK